MNLKRLIGLDNLAVDYAYARDPETGYTSARRIAETRSLGHRSGA